MSKIFQKDTGGTLTTNLQAYYKLEDATEFYVGGGTLDMTNSGAATFAAGKVNNAVNLVRASSQYLSVANNLGATNGAYSIAGWFRPASQPGLGEYYSMFGVFEAANDTGLSIAYRNNATIFSVQGVRTRHSVIDQGPDTIQTLDSNTWYHLAITYDATNVRTYLDGALLGGPTAASGNGLGGSANIAYIGNGFAEVSTFYHNGLVDEVGFWSKALSETEISDLYNDGAGQTMGYGSNLTLLGVGT